MVARLGSQPKSQFPAGLPRRSISGSPTEGDTMTVLQFPKKARSQSILSDAPSRSVTSSFMGFLETVAWAAFRDERVALAARWHSLDRPDLDSNWIGAAWFMLFDDVAATGGSLTTIEAEVIDKCASGQLQGKGQGGDGFSDIPENDWLGARFVVVREPDTILRAGHSGTGWTHVQFRRADVLALWPAPEPQALGAIAVEPQTNKRPVWYSLLRSMMQQEHDKLEAWPKDHPNSYPPQFKTAAAFGRMLVAKGFDKAPPSTVRYHVKNIKDELGR